MGTIGGVMAIFALVFIVFPLIEIYVAVQVAHVIGALDTVLLLAILSIGGTWLTKYAGFGVINRIRQQLAAGKMPTNELIDGGLVLTAGILLVVPGFVTGILGLLLLFPPTARPLPQHTQASLRGPDHIHRSERKRWSSPRRRPRRRHRHLAPISRPRD